MPGKIHIVIFWVITLCYILRFEAGGKNPPTRWHCALHSKPMYCENDSGTRKWYCIV